MTAAGPRTPRPASRSSAWAWVAKPTWRTAVLLTLALLTVRVAYLLWISPYELAADEAQYWDWSRSLELSYYTKGPGVAVAIRAATAVFGVSEGVVRLPAAVASAVAMLALARLASRVPSAGGLVPPLAKADGRKAERATGVMTPGGAVAHGSSGGTSPPANGAAAFYAAALFALVPAFAAVSQFMTIDMPYLACWAVACGVAWEAMRCKRGRMGWWMLLGAVLGVGFLFKYTILLLVAGLIGFAISRRRGSWPGLLIATLVFAVLSSPVWIWNHVHGWPTVAHLLGHLHVAGGDVGTRGGDVWTPLWLIEFLAAQLLIVGPAWVLIGLGVASAWWRRDAADAFCLWCGLPVLLFYLGVAMVTDAEANWPIAGYLTLLVLAARRLPGDLARYGEQVRQWLVDPARPKRGWLRRKPETAAQVAWHWSIGVGAIAALVIAAAPAAAILAPDLPGLSRITGHRATAGVVADLQRRLDQPILITDRYGNTALLAFYHPDRPTVYSAAHALGDRPSAYDQMARTDLDDPALLGRPAILVGASAARWREALRFERIEPAHETDRQRFFIGHGYGGVR